MRIRTSEVWCSLSKRGEMINCNYDMKLDDELKFLVTNYSISDHYLYRTNL